MTANRALQTSRPEMLKTLALFSPALAGVLLMLPRLASAQFGLLDDGQTITNALQVFQGNWSVIFENAFGRTRPFYWLFYTLIFKVAGRNPFWFFLVNLVVFLVGIVCIIALVRSLGGSRWQAWFAGLIFALSGPVIENTYTLSKAEMLQMVLLLGSLLCFARLVIQPKPWKCYGLIAGIAITTLLATLDKEVTLIVVAITCGWLVLAGLAYIWGRRKRPGTVQGPWFQPPGYLPALLVFLAAQGLAALAFLLIRQAATGSMAIQKSITSYATNFDLSLSKLAASFVHWGGWLLHDFPYLGVIIVFLIVWAMARKRLPQPALVLGAGVWMAAWFLFYLPWRFTVEYYLLPFAIGSSIVCGVVVGEAILPKPGSSQVARVASLAGLILTLVLFAVTVVNNVTNARVQLAVDDANAAMLDFVAAQAPQNGQVLLNLSPQSEYSAEIKMHLDGLELRPDLNVATLSAKTLAAVRASNQPYLLVSPELVNQLILSVRMGVSEPDVRQGNEALKGLIQEGPAQTILSQFRLLNIDLPRLMCSFIPGASYCAKNSTVIDQRVFTYGWKIYWVEAQ